MAPFILSPFLEEVYVPGAKAVRRPNGANTTMSHFLSIFFRTGAFQC